nr:NBS-LRR disease resistance protein [Dasypyrum villosum]
MVSVYTGVMNSLLGKLATLMGKEFARLKNLRKEVRSISNELTHMKDALDGLSDLDKLDPQTKRWRDMVREMSYDIEDIIDDFMQSIGENDKTTGLISNTVRRLKTLRAHHQIAGQIEEVKKLVRETSERHSRYTLHIPPSSDVHINPQLAAIYTEAADLVGIEGPANELVSWLMDEEKKLKAVSIVGFGGLGKTTLANDVYRRVKGEFDTHALVTVSQKPNIPNLLHSLLSKLGTESSIHTSESHLIDMLREHLQTKRYLIIIDDLWDTPAWDVIKWVFVKNDLASRIIITTRKRKVARRCCSHHRDCILQMKPLTYEDSARLFFSRIFGSKEACPPQLRDVSVEIIKKCGGLPLAVISISSMLANKDCSQKERWEYIQNSLGPGSNYMLEVEGMMEILNLSYIDLPPYLKACLLYLGMYPEDYEIERSNLERQWMAEGFIGIENGQDVEKVARNYFNELVNRSLIQPIEFDKQGSVTKCKVHDMLLDLILIKAAQENFLTIVDDPHTFTRPQYKVRRLSIRLDGASNGLEILLRNNSMSQVRSVMFFGSCQNTPPLSEFKFLRVVHIDLDDAKVDLTGLCKFYQLRYLCISDSCSYQLPTKIRVLQHLQTLELFSCDRVPSDIIHLPRLMFLKAWTRLPDGISNMKSLRHLFGFDFALYKLDNIRGLGELTNLKFLFLTCGIRKDDWERRMDALCSSLGNLCHLENLFLDLIGCIDGFMPLFPPPAHYRLERLIMQWRCWFSRVPSWMGELHNLCQLKFKVGQLLTDGVGILAELPALTHLDVETGKATNKVISIERGAFPALKSFKLLLSSASYLTFQAGAMPRLQRLKLKFNVHGSEQIGAAPAGLEQLLALEELTAKICCHRASESDKRSAESDLKSAIDMLPSHLLVKVSYEEVWNFGFSDD